MSATVSPAKRIPAQDGDIVEVRQVQEMTDASPEIEDLVPRNLKELGK